jgi:hypothetical protein
MTQSCQPSKRNRVKVSFWWQPPEVSNGNSSQNWVLACSLNQRRLPRFGQVITWRLGTSQLAGHEAVIVMGRGIVAEVTEINPGEYLAVLERNCREYDMDPLPYDELRDCLNTAVMGFHPILGCVEGSLVRLLPECDLAGIADPLINQGDKGESLVWVDWSTICKVDDLVATLQD